MGGAMAQKYTTVLRLRMTPEEYQAAAKQAALHHETVSAFDRNAMAGIPVSARVGLPFPDRKGVLRGYPPHAPSGMPRSRAFFSSVTPHKARWRGQHQKERMRALSKPRLAPCGAELSRRGNGMDRTGQDLWR